MIPFRANLKLEKYDFDRNKGFFMAKKKDPTKLARFKYDKIPQ
jgi:hypothetical protein